MNIFCETPPQSSDMLQLTSQKVTDSGAVRTFASYTDVATEAGLSRIYAGQHTRIDIEAGTTLGQSVAQFVLHHISA